MDLYAPAVIGLILVILFAVLAFRGDTLFKGRKPSPKHEDQNAQSLDVQPQEPYRGPLREQGNTACDSSMKR